MNENNEFSSENGMQNNYGGQSAEWYGSVPPQQPKKKKKIDGGTKKLIAVALVCSIVGGLVGAGLSSVVGRGSTTVYEGNRETSVIDVKNVDTSKVMTPAEVYAANVNSTVGITTSITTTNFWGYQTTAAASGSGFILTEDGYILTNYHVIESSNSITVTLYDNTAFDASVIGYDQNNDIAVLKIDAKSLTPVTLGDSKNLNVGDSVVAIGNPLGELTFSLTQGAVSALDREITLSTGVTMELIQTDCAINSGNSGGALFNLYGEVIGITNAKYSSSTSTEASIDNIGFAIPINSVSTIVKSIIENGCYIKPYIGVSISNVSEQALAYGLPEGAAIAAVTEDGPADKAGLQANDIVTAVNGEAITDSDGLSDAVAAASKGDKLELTVYRAGDKLTITVTVDEKAQDAFGSETEQESQSQQQYQSQQGQSIDPWSFFFGY